MKKCLLVCLAFYWAVGSVFCQSNKDTLSMFLIENGLENVRCKYDNRVLYISFENNKFRWEPNAFAVVISEIKKLSVAADSVVIYPLSHCIPTARLVLDSNASTGSFDRERAITSHFDRRFYHLNFMDVNGGNSSLRKFDFVVYPHFRTQFGNYDRPIETQIGLAPMLVTSLWPGMSLNLQVLFLFHNDMQGSSDRNIYPGLISINQLARLPFDVYADVSLGLFPFTRYGMNRHMYGTDVQLRKTFFNGKLTLGVNGSLTGFASFESGQLEYWNMDVFTGNLNLAFRSKVYDLWFKASAGRFLFSDNGIRFDVSREFKEVQVGFFFVASTIGHSGGFNFKIPIVPKRYFNPSRFRIRPANTFDWEFRANTVHPCVVQYKTGNEIDNLLFNANPDHLAKQVGDLIQNIR